MKDGRFLEAGATLIQEKLGQILQSVAKDRRRSDEFP
jgi:hypothetical protein